MNDKSCDPIVGLLVEYADGELPADEARRVADHLADCPDCRAELRLLECSLILARDVWQESVARAPTAGPRRRPDSGLPKESCATALSQSCATASPEAVSSHGPAEALLASKQWHTPSSRAGFGRTARHRVFAATCLAACAVVFLLAAGPWLFSRRQPRSEVNVPEEIAQSVPEQPAEEIDIEALIAREGRSARLAAAARLLAAQPGLQEYAQQAQRYLQEAYRGTTAVDGALPPPPSHPNKEPKS